MADERPARHGWPRDPYAGAPPAAPIPVAPRHAGPPLAAPRASWAPPHHAPTPGHRPGRTGHRAPTDHRPPGPPPFGADEAPRRSRADANPWRWLLLIPIVVPLLPGLYNRMEPQLLGLPFFYWCQLAFAFLATGVIAIVHLKER